MRSCLFIKNFFKYGNFADDNEIKLFHIKLNKNNEKL